MRYRVELLPVVREVLACKPFECLPLKRGFGLGLKWEIFLYSLPSVVC